MDKISRENYQVEDFITDESFINYHFRSNERDRLFWEEWLLHYPQKEALVKNAKEVLDALSLTISETEYSEELRKITAAINNNNPGSVFKPPVRNKILRIYHRKKRTMQYLLLLLLVFITGGYLLFRTSLTHSPELTETVNNGRLPLVLTLSDSTVVSLASHSYLRYPLQFEAKERNVYLYGNAQFNVKRNVLRPFKVYDENIVATVLGTVFNMKSSGDSTIEVELIKGKLNVQIMNGKMEPEQSVLLLPDERAVYVRNDKHLYKNLMIAGNRVYFHQNNFEEIASRIKDVFGITVVNQSGNKAWRFTGTFENSTAKDIIENICLVKKLSFVITGDTIVIK